VTKWPSAELVVDRGRDRVEAAGRVVAAGDAADHTELVVATDAWEYEGDAVELLRRARIA
jgi:hypothetical protein